MSPQLNPQDIKKLRELTCLPLLKCRQALLEAKGDIELAKKNLFEEWRRQLGVRPFLSEGNT